MYGISMVVDVSTVVLLRYIHACFSILLILLHFRLLRSLIFFVHFGYLILSLSLSLFLFLSHYLTFSLSLSLSLSHTLALSLFSSTADDGMNLSGSMVASSFGKLVMKERPRDGVKEEDLAIALLMMITNNIGTYLQLPR